MVHASRRSALYPEEKLRGSAIMPGPTLRERLEALVPSVLGWRTFPRAFFTLLSFGLTVVAGEWVVHQLEYLTEYGPHFGAVMATTPHRIYMMPLGVAFGLAVVLLLALACVVLILAQRARARLVRHLPARAARHVPALGLKLRPVSVAHTALLLAFCQVTVYVLQENVEGFALAGQWRGLSVLLAAQHVTVLPFHVLVAALGALLLWTLSSLLGRSRDAVRMARTLVAVLVRTPVGPAIEGVPAGYIPDLRIQAGALSLRSPPL